MKITGLLLMLSVVSVFASKSYSQTKLLNLNLEQTTVKDVLAKIEDQSEFFFMYSGKVIDAERQVSVKADNQKIDAVLNDIFAGTDVDYTIRDRIIVLTTPEIFSSESLVAFQQPAVSGTVTDESGEPLPGVTVVVKGTTQGTVTNADGEYTLRDIPEDATLVFSFVGMRTQEIPVGNQTSINVEMAVDAIGIEEVVAVGYGTVKKSDLTSAIAKVDGENLQARPVATIDQALQGQMAGVTVQQSGGKPGKNAVIRVRGVSSVTGGNDPLYVVDGFPVDAETFANIGLSNIESIEVLKDAASAAIYGSRGSNGVVIVTTKLGRKGQPLELSFNGYTGIANIERRIDFLSAYEYVDFMKDAKDNGWIDWGGDPNVPPHERDHGALKYDEVLVEGWLNDPFGVDYANLAYDYDEDLIQSWKDNLGPDGIPQYDHLGAILQTGITQSYQLSATGSTDNIRYMVSGEYFDQTGIVKNTDFRRYAFRSNLEADINNYLTFGLNLAPNYTVNHDKDTEGHFVTIDRTMISVPVLPPRLGYWGESDIFSNFEIVNDTHNALADIEHLKDEEIRAQTLANVYATVKVLPELRFKVSFGANYYNIRRDRFENQIIMREQAPQGQNWESQVLNWLNENVLTYDKSFEKHAVNAVLGFTAQKQQNKFSYIRGTGFANDYVPTLNAATSWTANTTMSEWSLLSYLGRVNYSFSGKYLLSASIRRDGSSRFGKNTRWGWFPSVSAGWRIEQENFMKSQESINRLKLRASWGNTGNNNIGNYTSVASLGTSQTIIGVNEAIVGGAQPSSLANSAIGWEKTTTLDIGVDVGLFQNRLSFTADYYNSLTSDILLNVPIPAITGFTSLTQNYGEVQNKGVEFEMATVNIDRAFKWSTNLNLSFNQNEVKSLGPDDAPIYSGYSWISGNNSITAVGYPIGSFNLINVIGVYNSQEEIDASVSYPGAQPGDVIIEDVNNDGVISGSDRRIFGSNNPKYYFGITNNFSYKNFDLSVLVNGLGGNQIYNSAGWRWNKGNGSHLQHYANWANRWRSPEQPGDGKTPRASQFDTSYPHGRTGSLNLYDGDYVRLKNVTLAYTLPSKLINRSKISNIRIYVQGENLYLWDSYIGFTPEVDANNGSAISSGYDFGTYPSTRTFLFGVNVTF